MSNATATPRPHLTPAAGPVVKSAIVVVTPVVPPPPRGSWANRLTVAVFVLFLLAPLVGSLLRPVRSLANENRSLSPAPGFPNKRWKLQNFPPVFDAYFKDRVGYRRELLDLRRTALVETLGVSVAENVWVGRDGWLFMNVVGAHGLPAAQPDPSPRIQRWADALDARRQWLAARGIPYLVLVAPEKSSVYPEFLPPKLQRHPPPDYLAMLGQRIPNLSLVDPLPAMASAKGAEPLYHHTDSHWNDGGAYVAYAELAQAIRREWPVYRGKAFADFRQKPWVLTNCDLTMNLGYPPARCVEDFILFHEPDGTTTFPPIDGLLPTLEKYPDRLRHLAPAVTESRRGVGRAVLLHDSFGAALQRHLASDFQRLTAVGTYGFPAELIAAEKPDVVIQVIVARSLAFVEATPFSTMTP